jgi:Large eukaryotic DNA virus major capsid protein/Major capsid protein N-terminus
MGGGLLQLVAYGAQDVYLTGNPQITFFKVVYRRHTNFAIEAIQQTFNGNAGYGNTVTCQISRNGDLINRMYLQVDVPKRKSTATTDGSTYQNYLGLRLIKSVVIEIGGQQIDKHYSDWLYIWNELSLPMGKRYAYDTMVGADKDILNWSAVSTTLYIPFEFWFCRNVGLALPLIALQYHEVKVKIDFETKENCVSAVSDFDEIKNISLWADYIFLDTDERRRFAQLSHEYLIEQLQFTGSETLVAGTNRIKLNFNHPCKELIWVAKPVRTNNKTRWYDYNYTDEADSSTASQLAVEGSSIFGGQYTSNYLVISDVNPPVYKNPFKNAILQLNGNDRFALREGDYFNHVQPFQHHTNAPIFNSINVYSFALKPEDHQPSGTLNMSRIDTATLMVSTLPEANNLKYEGINIYAVNYNVLRILSGMGGLAYSN